MSTLAHRTYLADQEDVPLRSGHWIGAEDLAGVSFDWAGFYTGLYGRADLGDDGQDLAEYLPAALAELR